jgi:hypothetical protein
VNIDETTHGFADEVYDRAQLIKLPLVRDKVIEHLDDAPYAELVLGIWDALCTLAPFGFRVLDEIQMYVGAAAEVETDWRIALDEQLVQKVLPRVRGADGRLPDALDAFLSAIGDEPFPLSRAKAEQMRTEYETPGFASFF